MRSVTKEQSPGSGSKTRIIRRQSVRTPVKGMMGDIADGNFAFAGTVENISSGGMKISNLPKDFSIANQSYRTVVSGDGKHYRILVRPCWVKRDNLTNTTEAGFKIVEASWEWEEFILGLVAH